MSPTSSSSFLNYTISTLFFDDFLLSLLDQIDGCLFGVRELLDELFSTLDLDDFLFSFYPLLLGREHRFMFLQVFYIFDHEIKCLEFNIQALDLLLAHSLLMVTKNGHLDISLVKHILFLLHGHPLEADFVELVLEDKGGIVGSEYFGSEALHLFLKIVI